MFFRTLLRLAFIGGVVFLFFTACASHKRCGEEGAKEKYANKRYSAALRERDSLCNVAKSRAGDIDELQKKLATVENQYAEFQKKSGSELDKLGSELGSKESMLRQREERLRQLESMLRRQDSLLTRLNNSVKNALLGFSPDELTVEMKNGKVYVSMSDKLLFKSGDANVQEKGREALKKVADVLNKNKDVGIAIEGHTDNVPVRTARYKDNWDLSAARATNVVRLLSDHGMDPSRLTASGKGEVAPVADNSTDDGKAKNRRTEIVLTPNLEELMKLITKN